MSNVVRALLYAQGMSLANRVRHRLRRLRQPKYMAGAIAGVAYMYFFVFRHLVGARAFGAAHRAAMPPELLTQLGAIGALVLLVVVVSAWLFPSDRAALRFSEAEVGFLFSAPVSRAALIHFSVLRAQVAIFVSAFIMTLLLRRGGAVGVNPLQYATGLWLMLATVRLHFLGASFTREQLLELGIRPWLRRAVVGVLVVVLAAACIAWAQRYVRAPNDILDASALAAYIGSVLGNGPAYWVLAPFRLVVAPMLASTTHAFLRALPAAALILLAHYAWVVRSQASFEEATIAIARHRAERVAAARTGRFRLRSRPKRARSAPFALAPRGFVPIAFLWKSLIAAGPLWRLRSLLIGTVLAFVATRWIGADPARQSMLQVIGIISLAVAGWLTIVGPMLMQRSLRETLEQLDVLRAMPLRGWQIALGQLLGPIAMLASVQGLALLAAALSMAHTTGPDWLSTLNIPALVAGGVLMAPLLCALMLCVPFAGMLLFPGWADASTGRGGGIDVMGQRMIFGGVYLVALLISLLPAAALAIAVLFAVRWAAGIEVAVVCAFISVCVVLAGEIALLLRWLGGRIERFDVSTEMR